MEPYLERYPRTLTSGITVRPMSAADSSDLLSFFRRIPVQERQLFREDVTQPSVIEGRVRNLNPARILPLVAFQGPRIVADATLHRDSGGWSLHLGKVRLTIDPEFRGRGLARLLLQEFLDLSKSLGVAILEGEILDVQHKAASLFEEMGFQCVATLSQHAIDLSGRVHDIRLYACVIQQPEGLAPEARLAEPDADVGGG